MWQVQQYGSTLLLLWHLSQKSALFVWQAKMCIRDSMLAAGDVQGFLDMGDRLDTLCLMAFNLYLADREQVYAGRVAQQRREASQIRRWAARHGLVENQDGE